MQCNACMYAYNRGCTGGDRLCMNSSRMKYGHIIPTFTWNSSLSRYLFTLPYLLYCMNCLHVSVNLVPYCNMTAMIRTYSYIPHVPGTLPYVVVVVRPLFLFEGIATYQVPE